MSALSSLSSMIGHVTAAFGRAITYRKVVLGAYNATTLTQATTTTDYAVTAVRDPSAVRTVGGPGGAKDATVHRYTIQASALDTAAGGTFTADANDRIVDGGVEYRITRATRSADGLAWVIEAQAGK